MNFVKRGCNLEIVCDPQAAYVRAGYRRQLAAAARLADRLCLRFVPRPDALTGPDTMPAAIGLHHGSGDGAIPR